MLQLEIDVKSMDQVMGSLKKLSSSYGVPIRYIVTDQMRLWVQDLVKPTVTVPRTKAAGRKAVSKYIAQIFAPIPPGSVVHEHGTMDVIRPKGKGVWAVNNVDYWPEGQVAGMRNIDKKLWNKAGRIQKRPRKVKMNGYTNIDKIAVKQATYRKYKRLMQKEVGRMKKGFIPALNTLGQAVNAPGRYPSWLRSAPVTHGGEANIALREGSGYVEAVNPVPYAEDRYESWLSSTRRKRLKDINGKLAKRMEDVTERFNRGSI